jgi:hypothetical protein
LEQNGLNEIQANGKATLPQIVAQNAKLKTAVIIWNRALEAADNLYSEEKSRTNVKPPELPPQENFPRDPKRPNENLQEARSNDGQPQFINVAYIAQGFTFADPAKPSEPRNSMVSMQPLSTPQPAGIGEKVDDAGYNKDPLMTSLSGGLGLIRVPYEERAMFGLRSVRDFMVAEGESGAANFHFMVGLAAAQLSQYMINVTSLPARPVEIKWRDPNASIIISEIDVADYKTRRVSVFEAQAMRAAFNALDALAEYYDVPTSEVTADWCWEKLPAHDINPASSTARGRELPQAALKIGGPQGKRRAAR